LQLGTLEHTQKQLGTLEHTQKVERVMDSDADRFRQYAAECRRLAQRASEKDKAILMEIAAAWIACAEQAERKAQSATKNK
jgi:phytoene/squalene synthetase